MADHDTTGEILEAAMAEDPQPDETEAEEVAAYDGVTPIVLDESERVL